MRTNMDELHELVEKDLDLRLRILEKAAALTPEKMMEFERWYSRRLEEYVKEETRLRIFLGPQS